MRKILVALLVCAIIILPVMTASGQQNNLIVSGRVTDEDGAPLIGTNVVLIEHDLGSATNVSGNYTFTVPTRYISGNESKVTARFIGYYSVTKTITTAGLVSDTERPFPVFCRNKNANKQITAQTTSSTNDTLYTSLLYFIQKVSK